MYSIFVFLNCLFLCLYVSEHSENSLMRLMRWPLSCQAVTIEFFLCICILFLCFCNVFSVFVCVWALWQLPDEVDEVAPKLPSSGNWGVLVQAKAEPWDNKYSEHLATDHPLYLWVALQRNLQNNFFSSTRDEKPGFKKFTIREPVPSTYSSNLNLITHKQIKQKPSSSNNGGSQADQRISGFPA